MKAVIFDFDGTLADSLRLAIDIYRRWARQPISDEAIEHLRSLPAQQVLRHLGIPFYRLPWLVMHGRNLMTQRLHELTLCKGMPELIQALHESGHSLYVISSNSTTNIETFLEAHGARKYFEQIHGGAHMFGKARALRRLMKTSGLKSGETVYIGDETRDIEAARKAHLTSVAVTWGYNSEAALRSYQPAFVATTPQQLLAILTTHFNEKPITASA